MERSLTFETLESIQAQVAALRKPLSALVHISDALELLRMLRKAGYQAKRVPDRSWWQVRDGEQLVADIYIHTLSDVTHGLIFLWETKLPDISILFEPRFDDVWRRYRFK